MTGEPVRTCWCGGELGKEIGRHYRCCNECGTAVLAVLPGPEHFDVVDDEQAFYGRGYWTDYSRQRNLPDIRERVRGDLSERCAFWLERLLEVTRPPGRALEIGCGHGAFVRLMQEMGFDAVGTELSRWVVDFARRTFEVPVLRGRLETLDLVPGFKCIAAFDVLEHVAHPLDMVRRCGELLEPDGVLLLQTPWYRGEGPDWSMFQADEHIHLFTDGSIRRLLAQAGFEGISVQASLFPYDMWVVASRGRLPIGPVGEAALRGGWRLPAAFQGLLGLSQQVRWVREDLAFAEADRAARLVQVEELTRQLREQTRRLQAAEADRAARLVQVEELTWQLREQTRQLQAAEADRAARLEQIHELDRLLREAEADRAARLEQIRELTRLLRESEADRAARLEVIRNLQAGIAQVKGTWAWRLYRRLPALVTGRRPVK